MSLVYEGGEKRLVRNFRTYSGRQLTSVMASTFQRKSRLWINSRSGEDTDRRDGEELVCQEDDRTVRLKARTHTDDCRFKMPQQAGSNARNVRWKLVSEGY